MPDDHTALLKEEYFHLQQAVEDFDQRALTIKAWSVTTSMAGIAASFLHDNAAILCLLSALASLAFWAIEVLWKDFQQSYYARVRAIERAFREHDASAVPLQIHESWSHEFHRHNLRRLFRIVAWPHVMLPHVLVFLAGVVIWLLRI
jgi:hypothetical protein